MADQDLEIGVKLGWQSDNAKLEEAQAHVESLGDSLTAMGEKAAAAFGAFFALSKVWSVLKEGADAASKMEESIAALRGMVVGFGGDAERAVADTQGLATKLEAMGVNAVQTTDAVRKLTMITGGEYKDALAGVELATRVSIGLHVDFSQALMLVQLAMEGSPRAVSLALRRFGIHAKDGADLLKQLTNRTQDLGPALDTTAAKTRVANEEFSAFFRTVGELFNKVKIGVIEAWHFVETIFQGGFTLAAQAIGGLVNLMAFADKVAHGANIKAAWAEMEVENKKVQAEADARWDQIVVNFRTKVATLDVEVQKAGDAATVSEAARKAAAAKEAEKAAKKAEADLEKAMDERAKAWQKEDQAELDAERKKKEERLKLVLEYYKFIEQKETDETAFLAKSEEARLAREQAYNTRRLAILKAHQTAADAIVHKGVDVSVVANMKILRDEIATKQAQLKLAQDNGEATDAITTEIADLQITEAQIAADAGLGILSDLFPKQKEFKVAEAIIDTIASSVKAYNNAGGYPEGLIPMAISLATGFAKVAQIESTNPGSGGSSGGGSGGGATSAPTVPSVYSGYNAIPPTGSRQTTNVTTNKPTLNNVTINAIDTNNALRTLQTNLRPASRNYDRSIGTRAAVHIGSKRGQ